MRKEADLATTTPGNRGGHDLEITTLIIVKRIKVIMMTEYWQPLDGRKGESSITMNANTPTTHRRYVGGRGVILKKAMEERQMTDWQSRAGTREETLPTTETKKGGNRNHQNVNHNRGDRNHHRDGERPETSRGQNQFLDRLALSR